MPYSVPTPPQSEGAPWRSRGNPYDVLKAFETVKNNNKAKQVADMIGRAIASMRGQGGGGGTRPSVASAPVSTLASLPNTPVVQDLIKRGLIREGMPPEQAMAIIAMQGVRTGVGVDIDALMKAVEATYANTSGDILTAGQQWMKDLYGTNYDPNNPNAAMFAQDPIFSSYAGGMAQIDETSDLNLATDLAWFEKNKAAQQAYYDAMMASTSGGTLLGSGSSGGGGGGGGGRRRGGGSGSDEEEPEGFSVPEIDLTETESDRSIAQDEYQWDNPRWMQTLLGLAQTPQQQELVWEAVSNAQNPEAMAQYLIDNFQTNEAAIEEANIVNTGNEAWNEAAPSQLDQMLQQYTSLTGRSYDPETGQIVTAEDFEVPGPIPENMGEMEALFNQAYTLTPELLESEAQRQAVLNSPAFRQMFGLDEEENSVGPNLSPIIQNSLDDPSILAQVDPPLGQPYVPGSGQMPTTEIPNPRAGEVGSRYNFDEGSYGIDYFQEPDTINSPNSTNIFDWVENTFNTGTSTGEPVDYDGERNLWLDENGIPVGTAITEDSDIQPLTEDEAILYAVQDAQRYTDPNDFRSNNAYFSDTYSGLPPVVQAAVDQILNQEGIGTPNSSIQEAAARRLHSALVNEQNQGDSQNSILDRTVGAIPLFGRTAAENMEQSIANQVAEDETDLLHYGNRPRPDLIATMQAQSRGKYAQSIPEGMTPEQYNELVAPGTYWMPGGMTEEEIAETEAENTFYETLMRQNMLMNDAYQMNQTQSQLTDSVMEQSQLRANSDIESIPVAEELTALGDPNNAPLEILDPVPEAPVQGYFGQARPISRQRQQPTGVKTRSRSLSGAMQKPAADPMKLLAAQKLASAMANYRKKRSGRGFGKYG